MDSALLIGGFVLNLAATLGGFVRLAMSFERRITAVETHLLHVMPKRRGDLPGGG
jgi:hypothetical protein